jgi:hypothetical protein
MRIFIAVIKFCTASLLFCKKSYRAVFPIPEDLGFISGIGLPTSGGAVPLSARAVCGVEVGRGVPPCEGAVPASGESLLPSGGAVPSSGGAIVHLQVFVHQSGGSILPDDRQMAPPADHYPQYTLR